jgi:hypothetical protein
MWKPRIRAKHGCLTQEKRKNKADPSRYRREDSTSRNKLKRGVPCNGYMALICQNGNCWYFDTTFGFHRSLWKTLEWLPEAISLRIVGQPETSKQHTLQLLSPSFLRFLSRLAQFRSCTTSGHSSCSEMAAELQKN